MKLEEFTVPRTAKPEDVERNAGAETLYKKWPWRLLWSRNRCIIPVTGFFEPHRLTEIRSFVLITTQANDPYDDSIIDPVAEQQKLGL